MKKGRNKKQNQHTHFMKRVKTITASSIMRMSENIYGMHAPFVAGKASVAEVGFYPPPLTIFNILSSIFFLPGLSWKGLFYGSSEKSYGCLVSSPELPLESFRTLRKLHRMFRNPNRKSVKLCRTLAETHRTFVKSYGAFAESNETSGNPYGSFMECNESFVATTKHTCTFSYSFINPPACHTYAV